jgi:uncharacterized protein YxeA
MKLTLILISPILLSILFAFLIWKKYKKQEGKENVLFRQFNVTENENNFDEFDVF